MTNNGSLRRNMLAKSGPHIVVDPITQAENPYEAYQEIKKTGAESNMTKVAKRLPKIY